MEDAQFYNLETLAGIAGVTPRTIRFYTAEGLLPPPRTRGRYAVYTDEHLNRLRLIARLKEAYLPLQEIKNRIEAAPRDEPYELLLSSAPQSIAESEPPEYLGAMEELPLHAAAGSAADYVARTLARQTEPATPPELRARAAFYSRAPIQEPSDTWNRVEIVPGIELHVRAALWLRFHDRIERLIAFARSLFRNV